ncbi:MAG: DUF948 domain-containing protein [Candidatus Gastranaerophilales bacterium]|nr:DUF948 domain-containing protein [Candidatus Gastranaerophilales bacterium]
MNGLDTALTFLAYTCVILFTLLTGFIIKLAVDLMGLIKSYRELADTINEELEPTLTELKKALDNINSLALATDKQFSAIKTSLGSAYNLAYAVGTKVTGGAFSLLSGFLAGLKLFLKK